MYAESLTSDIRIMRNVIEGANILRENMASVAKQRITGAELGLLRNTILFERYRPHDKIFNVSMMTF